ncbi:GL17625 [Drosophila persimilis]|uniref:GL17625 n=1 Tax=Drosophila persimilis TaxID=7234 RepID=B4GI01_DROPE|nr:GL17625 [Drosophila persimilis]
MATSKSSLLISLIVFGFAVSGVSCKVEFTNLKCTTLDREFLEFDKCFLKSINRTYKYLSVSTKIHMLPLKSVSVRRFLHLVFDRSHHTVPFQIQTQVLQRLNGYKPFLFNFTTDGCKALSGKMNPTTRFFFGLIAPYSNLNHSCPYDHDLFVEKLPISFMDEQLTKVLPFPEGDYCLKSIYSYRRKPRAEISTYASIS